MVPESWSIDEVRTTTKENTYCSNRVRLYDDILISFVSFVSVRTYDKDINDYVRYLTNEPHISRVNWFLSIIYTNHANLAFYEYITVAVSESTE